MKKSIIILIILIIGCVALVGCTTTIPHKGLNAPWGDREEITYNAVRTLNNGVKIEGEQTIVSSRIKEKTDEAIIFGEQNYENFNGYLIEINTNLADGTFMKARLLLKNTMAPVAAEKEIFVKGYENEAPAQDSTQKFLAFYEDGKNYTYTGEDNGSKIEGSVKIGKWESKPYFDNMSIYHVARSSYKSNGFGAFDFEVPVWSDNSVKKLSMQPITNGTDEIEAMGQKIVSTNVQFILNQSFPGTGESLKAYYSKEPVEGVSRMLVKYEECSTKGDLKVGMVYTLKSVKLG